MTTIRVIEEIIEYPVRVLVCECGCGLGCGWGEILAQRLRDEGDKRSKLWVAMGPEQMEQLHKQAREIVDLAVADVVGIEAVDRLCAYVGLPFENLQHPHVCRLQEEAFQRLEAHHGMCDPEWVWSVRRSTFGDPLTCVMRAVDGIGAYYVPDVDHPQ